VLLCSKRCCSVPSSAAAAAAGCGLRSQRCCTGQCCCCCRVDLAQNPVRRKPPTFCPTMQFHIPHRVPHAPPITTWTSTDAHVPSKSTCAAQHLPRPSGHLQTVCTIPHITAPTSHTQNALPPTSCPCVTPPPPTHTHSLFPCLPLSGPDAQMLTPPC